MAENFRAKIALFSRACPATSAVKAANALGWVDTGKQCKRCLGYKHNAGHHPSSGKQNAVLEVDPTTGKVKTIPKGATICASGER